MEALVQTEISAVKHVVVSGGGKEYLACLLTLVCEDNSNNLAGPALSFAHACGSPARTVDQARRCDAFRDGLLRGFANCNKLVCESSKRAGIKGRPAQLRRFTILSQHFTPDDGTLKASGAVDRKLVISRLGHVIESMYGAVKASAGDVKPLTTKAENGDVDAHSYMKLHTTIPHAHYGTPVKDRHDADRAAQAQMSTTIENNTHTHVHAHAGAFDKAPHTPEKSSPGVHVHKAPTPEKRTHLNGVARVSGSPPNVIANSAGVVFRKELSDSTRADSGGHSGVQHEAKSDLEASADGQLEHGDDKGGSNGDIVVSSVPNTSVNGHLDLDADGHVTHAAANGRDNDHLGA